MSYHSLSECTLSPQERLEEAVRIMDMLENSSELRDNECGMMNNVVKYQTCSVKQLFWLRDIWERVQ
jgi:hypothetical protein